MTHEDVAAALNNSRWIYAKTMPWCPHWYTLRKEWHQPVDFEELVQFIRDHGYREKFGKSWYTRLNVGPYKHWTMGSRLSATILINKAFIDPAEERAYFGRPAVTAAPRLL